MFGHIMANVDALAEEEKERYGAVYCGLCDKLKEKFGSSARMCLQFCVANCVTPHEKLRNKHKKYLGNSNVSKAFLVEVTGFVSARRRKGEGISPFLRASGTAGSLVPPAHHSLPARSNPATLSVEIQRRTVDDRPSLYGTSVHNESQESLSCQYGTKF